LRFAAYFYIDAITPFIIIINIAIAIRALIFIRYYYAAIAASISHYAICSAAAAARCLSPLTDVSLAFEMPLDTISFIRCRHAAIFMPFRDC
jgi:hypothetical protein